MADVTRIGSMTVAPTPPDCPLMGDEWWNTVNGQLFVYYDDGDTRQWVIANRSGPAGPAGPQGPQGPPGSTGGVFDVRDFGASTALADNTGATIAAIAAANAAGGGTVYFPPGTWKFLSRIDTLNGVALRGVPGMTKLDFSGKTAWENNFFTGGLIQGKGVLGTPVALAQSTKRTVLVPLDVVTATMAGLLVTAATDLPHGFAVGDPIWVLGFPLTAGQGAYFTVNFNAGTSAARTDPFIVASIIDPTHFTYTVRDAGGDATLATTAICSFSSDTILVASTTGFAAGQDVMIRSQAFRMNSTTEQNHLGELAKIAKVVSSTTLRLHADVQDEYLVSDTAEIVPVTLRKNFAVEGIEVVGKGPHTVAGVGDRGIVAYLCDNPRVENCIFTHVDYNAAYFWSTLNGTARGNVIAFDASDEAGSSSGLLDVQYGIGFGGCTTGLDISNNYVWGGRHAIVQTFTSSPLYHGVSRNIHTIGNTMKGQWLAAISSHQGADTWTIVGNTVSGAHSGINPRFCRDVVMTGNVLNCYTYGIYVYNAIGNFVAASNTINSGLNGIRVGRDVDPATDYGPFKIIGNNISGGDNAILIIDATLGTIVVDMDISGNTLSNTKLESVRVVIGDNADATAGWYGKINNNTIINPNGLGTVYGMRLSNFRGGQLNNNTFKGVNTIAYGVYIEGAGTGNGLQIIDNYFAPGLVSSRTLNVTAGTGHFTNTPPTSISEATVIIAAGVATPRFAAPLVPIDTEGATAADDLDTLAAGYIGQTVILRAVTSSRVVTVRDGTGNIQLAGSVSRVLDNTRDTIMLMWDSVSWNEVAFASN